MDIQQGHEAGTWRMDMQHGDVHVHTRTCTYTYMYVHVHVRGHARICVVHIHLSVQTCTHLCTQKCTYTRTYTVYINLLLCSKISLRSADFTDGILPKRNETWP
jgi:hypothetical protein